MGKDEGCGSPNRRESVSQRVVGATGTGGRRRFLKLALVGAGSGIVAAHAGGRRPPVSNKVNDFVDKGKLATRGLAGSMTVSASRSFYSIDVSAAYELVGSEISFEKLDIYGTPLGRRGAKLTMSRASALKAQINESGCFRIAGAAAMSDDSGGVPSAKIFIDGCVVSDRVPSLRGVIYREGTKELASTKITFG